MIKALALWQFIAGRLQDNQRLMLLLVAESSGSSPGRQGFKMAVADDDQFHGSIGGGIMEVKLVELAKDLLKEEISLPKIKKQIHRKNEPRDQSGMICSGEQTVFYFTLDALHLEEVLKIIDVLGQYKSSQLNILYSNQKHDFSVTAASLNSGSFQFAKVSENEFTWQEVIGYKQRLYIVGGGHCALALSELMSGFEFYIHVIDDRPDLNTLSQNSFAHEKHVIENYDTIGELIPSGPDVFVVVMTLGYRSDLIVLQQLGKNSFAYLGLMGSEAKVSALKEELMKTGFPEILLQNMHAPIGLKINSHTPEEIAVSIAAELILVKNTIVVSA
ncbi:MAG: XdhC family protein [Saprospiraceae bacterium]|uniref:XdhC family protein n=1 Tax=Candidatus Opimibacter skivensis TaxID=2982028 RepID=A0A9D7XSS5_9BACT|nr:XdhC family protein [Candidatus Opimibacter skivensis]